MDESDLAPRVAPSVAAAARRLDEASASGYCCRPVRDLIGDNNIEAAYAVQQQVARARVAGGVAVIGRKVGLTSAAVQQQLGVDQPDFGMLFDDMAYGGGDIIAFDAVLQPRVEAEIAFVLKDDLVDGALDDAQVRAAIDYAVAALEVCGSRIEKWDISLSDTIADNASAGAFVLGPLRMTLDSFEPKDVSMTMEMDGQVVSTGTGAACLGDPINAVVWLARVARDLGDPLRAGQIVLSGALGPMQAVAPGSTVTATITGLGKVAVVFSEDARAS